MVSARCLILSALVFLAAGSAHASYSASVKPLCGCYNQYYSGFGLNLSDVLSSVGNLLQGLLSAVGLVVNAVTGLVGGLLSLLGLGGSTKVTTINDFLVKPTNDGSGINLLIKICLAGKPILDNVQADLGLYFTQAAIANIVIGVSASGKTYSGLGFKPLTGSKQNWLKQLGCSDIGTRWNSYLSNNGIKISALVGAKGALFTYIDRLVNNLVGGVETLTVDILYDVVEIVCGVFALLTTLVDGVFGAVEGLLGSVLSVFGNYYGGLLGSVNFTARIKANVGSYSYKDYNSCFETTSN